MPNTNLTRTQEKVCLMLEARRPSPRKPIAKNAISSLVALIENKEANPADVAAFLWNGENTFEEMQELDGASGYLIYVDGHRKALVELLKDTPDKRKAINEAVDVLIAQGFVAVPQGETKETALEVYENHFKDDGHLVVGPDPED